MVGHVSQWSAGDFLDSHSLIFEMYLGAFFLSPLCTVCVGTPSPKEETLLRNFCVFCPFSFPLFFPPIINSSIIFASSNFRFRRTKREGRREGKRRKNCIRNRPKRKEKGNQTQTLEAVWEDCRLCPFPPKKGIQCNYYVHQREDGERNAVFFLNCLPNIGKMCKQYVSILTFWSTAQGNSFKYQLSKLK